MNKSYHNKNDVSSSGFEDSEGEIVESNEESQQNGDVLQKFLTTKGYKGLKVQKIINSPQIESDDEEVYLLRIPKSIDPSVLENTKFSLNKASKVKTESGKFCMKPLADVPEPKFFLHSNGLKKISPVSMFQLEKFVETPHKEKDTIEENEIQPTPRNLIPRHTIFGAKYVERINLQEQIQQKLQEALQRFEKKNKVSKRKKKQIVDTEEFDDKSLLISQILEAKFKDKKSVTVESSNEKNKKISEDSISNTKNIIDTEPNIKQDFSYPQCEKASGKKKKRIMEAGNISIEIKKEVLSESEMTDSNAIKKKKKSRTRDYDPELITPEIIKQEVIEQNTQEEHQTVDEKKRKKKKKVPAEEYDDKSLLISQILETKLKDNKVSDNENENSNKKNKKKRNYSDSVNVKIESVIQIEPYLEQDQTLLSKKKKKSKESRDNSIVIKKEVLSESETQELSTNEKKKKKRKRDSDAALITPETIKQEFYDGVLPPSKKRRPSILSSTVIKDGSPDFLFDVSVIETDKKKKNPKKSDSK